MKFVRLSEYRPEIDPETQGLLDVYAKIWSMQKELHSALVSSGRQVTASINLLQTRIAQATASPALEGSNEVLVGRLADELSRIKMRFPEPQEQRNAISQLLNTKGGYREWILTNLYSNYLPKLERALIKGYGGAPPVSESVASDIAMSALQNFFEDKDTASIVNTLAQFDSSKGSLMNWIEGGLLATTKKLAYQDAKLQNSEVSTNQTIGDNNDTQIEEMLPDDSGTNEFEEISSYREKASQLFTAFSNYIRDVEIQLKNADEPALKLKTNALLQHLKSENNEVVTKIQELESLGNQIDKYDANIQEITEYHRELMWDLSRPNPDQNIVKKAPALIEKLKQMVKNNQNQKGNDIKMFNATYTKLQELIKYDANTGKTLIDPDFEKSKAAQDIQNSLTIKPATDNPQKEMVPQGVSQPVFETRSKARGGRELLSPEHAALLEEQHRTLREKVRPSLYRTMSYPSDKKELADKSSGLYSARTISKHIHNLNDLEALQNGNLQNVSTEALYADIITKGLLYVRDQAAMDKAYDSEVTISGASELRRAMDKFRVFVNNEIATNPLIKTSHFAKEENRAMYGSPENFMQKQLEDLIKNEKSSYGSTDVNKFRTLYEYFDHMVRASSYDAVRKEKYNDAPWEELSDQQRSDIAQQVYDDQYSFGYRPMFISRYRDNSMKNKKFEPRYPMSPDKEGQRYKDIMARELWRIGRMKALQKIKNQKGDEAAIESTYPSATYNQYRNPAWNTSDWYEISDNPKDFKSLGKIKPPIDNPVTSEVVQTLVRLANRMDELGEHEQADAITDVIKELCYD